MSKQEQKQDETKQETKQEDVAQNQENIDSTQRQDAVLTTTYGLSYSIPENQVYFKNIKM